MRSISDSDVDSITSAPPVDDTAPPSVHRLDAELNARIVNAATSAELDYWLYTKQFIKASLAECWGAELERRAQADLDALLETPVAGLIPIEVY
jgi:hypothetical protein